MKRNRKPFYLAAAICIAAGLMLCTAALVTVGGEFSVLSTTGPYEERRVSYPAGEYSTVTLLDRNTPVRLEHSADGQIHITYYENEREEYRLSATAGELRLEKTEHKSWLHFVMNFHWQDTAVVIALPEQYAGEVSLETTNASVSIEELALLGGLGLKTTNNTICLNTFECAGRLQVETTNGGIELNHVTAAEIEGKTTNHSVSAAQVRAEGSFTLTTTNGGLAMEGVTASAVSAQASNHSIQADEVTTQGRLELRTTNGSVRFERLLPGLSAELVTTNGTVCGTVLDRLEEYTIESRTTNATSNLPERFNGGPKSLTVSTTNGKIDVQFIG